MDEFADSNGQLPAPAAPSRRSEFLSPRLQERLTRSFVRIERRLLSPYIPPTALGPIPLAETSWQDALRHLVVTACCAALILGFIGAVSFYASSTANVTAHPEVVDVGHGGAPTFIAFGSSPLCDGQDCRLSHPRAAAWTAAPIPNFDLRSHADYQRGLRDGFVYYFFDLQIPPQLRQQTDSLSFSPRFIHHHHYEAYVNGRLIYGGGSPKAHIAALVNIPLPMSAVQTGKVPLVIKATLEPNDLGIYHRSSLFLGPTQVLDGLLVANEREMSTYFLLFILTKGSIFLIFAFIYLFTQKTRSLGSFLVYALATTLDPLLAGDFFTHLLSTSYLGLFYFLLRSISAFALLRFFVERCAVRLSTGAIWWISGIGTAAVALAAYDYGWGGGHVTIPALMLATNLLHWVVIAFGAFASTIAWTSAHLRARANRHQATTFVVFLVIYLGLGTWQIFFFDFDGFSKWLLFELLFFYAIAWELSREFGLGERRLAKKTLELADARVDHSVAHITRMLAHDIRSPFASLRMILDIMTGDEDAQQLRVLKGSVLPAIREKLTAVDEIVADILAASASVELRRTTVSLAHLIEVARADILLKHADAKVVFSYKLHHRYMLNVDHHKINRVLTNIVENAMQAINGCGSLWFHTQDLEPGGNQERQVLLTIGNSGSYIEPEGLTKVFDVFYTKGKIKGTGLGLAVAKKIVSLHGGRIWCTSSRQLGTEFHLTLPTSHQLDPVDPVDTGTALTLPEAGQDEELAELEKEALAKA